MPRHGAEIYRRGKYWLAWDERADGSRRSPYLTIFWYDSGAGRVRSASTRTAEKEAAIDALDRRYLADNDEAPAFCHACGRPIARAASYLLADAIGDYRLEHGDQVQSADSVVARLKRVADFLAAGDAHALQPSGDPLDALQLRFGARTSCADAATKPFAEALRGWLKRQPAEWRRKDGSVAVSRPLAPSTVEESITQLCAVLNHAVDRGRSDARPTFRPIPRKRVSQPRRVRIDVPTIARMVAYAAEPGKRRGSLHAFLVASICTIARPDAIVDINVAPDRGQWWPGSATLALNQNGRSQTKKYRPVLPVLPLLGEWLALTLADWRSLPEDERAGAGFLVNYYGRAVQDVDSAWGTMLSALGLPREREWQPYVLRHSLATIARNRGASKWDLEGFMGHRAPGQTEVYAIGEFVSVEAALQSIIDEIGKLAPGCLHRRSTGARLSVISGGGPKMPG